MNIKVMSFGYGGHAWMSEELRPIIETELGMNLITIHEHENADIKWERTTWISHLKQADIIIVPSNCEVQSAKSSNRLTQAMSLGKPIVCSPLPSYLDINKNHPECFLIAYSKEEWKDKLKILRDNEDYRKVLGLKALEASKEYSIDVVGLKWLEILKAEEDSVDIIIPTYKNFKCLKLCLDSIKKCTKNVSYKIKVIDGCNNLATADYLESNIPNSSYISVGSRLDFATAVNMGIKCGTSKYICILNDDVIVSEDWLNSLIKSQKENNLGAVGPLSNCDKGWLHNIDININGVDLLPGINTYDQILSIVEKIHDFKSNNKDLIFRDWIAFYCTLIPRVVIEKVGYLDETFSNSGEDVDYCNRIKKCGLNIAQTYESFCFHFGAVGRSKLEAENYDKYHESDKRTVLYLNEKYNRQNIVLYSGPSWEQWDFRNISIGGIGGSETWQIWLAREFDKLGYRVKSFCDCPNRGIMDGSVEYKHYSELDKYVDENYIDYFISSRTTDPFKLPIRSNKNFCQIHDVFLLSNKDQLFLDKINKFCTLSDWHKDFVSDYHGISKDKIEIMANGLDFERYKNPYAIKKIPNRLFYSSSADRGLDTLLYLFPFIKKEIPDLTLHIFYGFNTWELSVKQRNNPDEVKKMEEIKRLMQQDGVYYHGRVNQNELAEEQLRSSLWVYPSDFEESFCITALEAQRSRCPVISSNYAGLKTTIGNSGDLIGNGFKGESYTKEYREKFVEECVSILKDKDKWEYWSELGFKNTEKYSWANIALMWQKLFN